MELILDHLRWPWVLAAVGAGVFLLLVWWARPPRRARRGTTTALAHADALRALPRYRELAGRERRRGLLLTLGALVVVAGAAVVVARPQTVETEPRESRARDIMLCLDASASMDDDNAIVVSELRSVIDQLEGDRVGMMIWSSATVMVFPLTDDYDYVRDQLDAAEAAFSGSDEDFYEGVDLGGVGASLIGDGIVSCTKRFDRPAKERTRVLVVASDNEPLGERAYSLAQAAAYARKERVLVYGIGAASLEQRVEDRDEFADAAVSTGGLFAVAGSGDAAGVISRRIRDLARARSDELARSTTQDEPLAGVLVAGCGLVVLTGASLVGRRRRS